MFLPGSEPNSSVVHPEVYSTLHHYPQSGKCKYAFILNKYAEHSPLWAANGRTPTQESLSLVQYPKDPYHIQAQPYCEPDDSSLHHHAFLL